MSEINWNWTARRIKNSKNQKGDTTQNHIDT